MSHDNADLFRVLSFTGFNISMAAIKSSAENMYLRVLPVIMSEKNPPKNAKIEVSVPIIKKSFQDIVLFLLKKNEADREETIKINCPVVAAWCMVIPASARVMT